MHPSHSQNFTSNQPTSFLLSMIESLQDKPSCPEILHIFLNHGENHLRATWIYGIIRYLLMRKICPSFTFLSLSWLINSRVQTHKPRTFTYKNKWFRRQWITEDWTIVLEFHLNITDFTVVVITTFVPGLAHYRRQEFGEIYASSVHPYLGRQGF